jgi:hypothetical protein
MPLADDQNMIQALTPKAFRSGVQRMGSATATSVIWVGHESPRLDPPHGVGGEPEALLRLEALDRLHQAVA